MAICTWNVVAIGIGGQQGDVADIGIGQQDAQTQSIGLDISPGRHVTAAVGADVVQHAARGVQFSVHACLVLAQKDLVRGVRGVGLALVHKGGNGVGASAVDVVGRSQNAVCSGILDRAGQHHEVGMAADHIQRVVRLQWNEHGACAGALGHQVEAMVKELAEHRHPGIEGSRKTGIWRDVKNHQ